MATLNETFTNDEDYAMILQTEEMTMSNIRNLVTRQTNNASNNSNSRSQVPNYVCIEDEIITIDDDDEDDDQQSDSIIHISSNSYNDNNTNNNEREDLLKKDELMAKKLQEDFDKEMAESIQSSNNRVRRTDLADFQVDSTSPFHNNNNRRRNRISINNIMGNNIETTNRYRTHHRHLNAPDTSNSNIGIASTEDFYQGSLNEFYRQEEQISRRNQNAVNMHVNYFNHLYRLNDRSRNFSSDDYENLLRLDEMNVKKGLSKEELNSLPKFEFKLCNDVDVSDRTCSICQDEFENKSELSALTCTHKFHFTCIKEWLKQSRRCPLCTKDAINGN